MELVTLMGIIVPALVVILGVFVVKRRLVQLIVRCVNLNGGFKHGGCAEVVREGSDRGCDEVCW